MKYQNEKIKEIENEIDTYYKTKKIYKLDNRPLAQWYLLLMHEEFIRLPIMFPRSGFDWVELVARIEKAKGSLEWVLRWTDKLPDKNFSIPNIINEKYYEYAQDLFFIGIDYYGIIAPFTLWHRGIAAATFDGDNTIRFKRNTRELAFDVFGTIDRQDPNRNLLEFNAIYSSEIDKQFQIIYETAKPIKKVGLKYKVNHKNLKPLIEYFERKLIKTSNVTEDWLILGISINDIRRFFASLLSLCQVHITVMLHMFKVYKINDGARISALITRNKNEWIIMLAKYSNVSDEIIGRLIEIFTYDREFAKRDMSLQPFFPITSELLTICPHLVLFSDLERNFRALMAKKYKDEYDQNSCVFEKKMLSECEKLANKNKISFKKNMIIPEEPSLPDIDSIFFDEKSNCLLVCELKAVIPPSEPAEVIERNNREHEGIEQIKAMKKFSKNNPKKFFENIFGKAISPAPDIYFAVLLQGSYGSAKSIDEGIPTIELTHFSKLMDKIKDFKELCQYIKSFSYLPKEGVDFDISEQTLKFGEYKILWEAYTLKS